MISCIGAWTDKSCDRFLIVLVLTLLGWITGAMVICTGKES